MPVANNRGPRRSGEEELEVPPPPHSQPEPDVPDPDETQEVVRPVRT